MPAPVFDVEEPSYDDVTIGLQIQQFFDEWHYRVLHSGLAYDMDRTEVITKALELFVMAGMQLSDWEQEELAEMEDEADMVRTLVRKMPMQMRKTFEHFSLQLQLVVSAATRVRHALEESETAPEEVARVMEDGDAGIGQQVLKQAVIEASLEVSNLVSLRDSWVPSMDTRVKRLMGCAAEAEHANSQYEAISTQVASFGGDQNAKAKGVLLSMASSQDKALLSSIFRSWMGSYLRDKMESSIHTSFRRQIEDANQKLLSYQTKQVRNIREVLERKARGVDHLLMTAVVRRWAKAAEDTKDADVLAEKNAQLKAKLEHYKKSSQENTKRVMTRMAADNDEQLISMVFQALHAYVVDYQKNKELEDQVKATEQKLAAFTESKSEEAKKVLHRMLSQTESGLLVHVMQSWVKSFLEEKKHRQFQEGLNSSEHKFSALNARQKKAAKNMAERTNQLDALNLLHLILFNWSLEVRLDRVFNHYSSKLEGKKNQLQAVQSMFQTFATQLEQTTGNSPRSTAARKEKKEKKEKE